MPFPENKYSEFSWIKGNPDIGEGTWIGPFCIIDGTGGLSIGKCCDIKCWNSYLYALHSKQMCVRSKVS